MLPWFTCVMVATFGFLWRLSGGISHVCSRFLVSFLGMPFPLRPWRQRRRRHKRIRGIGSQSTSRRGAKPRLSALVFKARPHQFGFICGAFASRYVLMSSRPRSSFLAAAVMGMILGLFVGLRLEQAPYDILRTSLLRPLSHTIPFQEMLGGFRSVCPSPLLGTLGVCWCMCVLASFSFSLRPSSCRVPSLECRSNGSRNPRHVAFGRFVRFTLFCATLAVLVISWQISLNGIRVGEASLPGPPALNVAQASNGVTVPLPLSQVADVDLVMSPGTLLSQWPVPSDVSGSEVSPAVVANPYVAANLPSQPLLARPPRFCSFSRPSSAACRLRSQDRSARDRSSRPASRRSRSLPQAAALVPAGQSSDPPLSRSHARLFCPAPSCSDSGPPSHGWASFGSMRPHVDAHLAGQLAGDFPMDWLRGRGFGTL